MREKRTRLAVITLVALIAIGALLVFWHRQRPESKVSRATSKAAALDPEGREHKLRATPEPSRLDATEMDWKEARRILVLALKHLIDARSYKSVMTTTGSSGNGQIKFYSSLTLQHLRSPTRGDLFRCDTLNFSGPADHFTPETMALVPGTARTEITNEDGNWDFGEGGGREGKVFQLTGSEVPLETVDMHRSLQMAAQQLEDDPDPSALSAANESDRGTPVVAIKYAASKPNSYNATYLIDTNTGELRTIEGGDIRRDFDLSAPIDESEFTVPASLAVTQVEDQEALRRYLRDHSP